MKSLFILGNWKSNKTRIEAKHWIDIFTGRALSIPSSCSVIVCPAYHHLDLFLDKDLPFSLGVQDVSPFPSGAYTGEVSGQMLEGLVQYALLGHSERRKYFGETDEMIARKVEEAHRVNIQPIVCVSDVHQASRLFQLVPDFETYGKLLYEPVFAIGSGQADSPENANNQAKSLRSVVGDVPVLYGGSVLPENVRGYVKQEYLAGIGVGGASLDAEKFAQLIQTATSSNV